MIVSALNIHFCKKIHRLSVPWLVQLRLKVNFFLEPRATHTRESTAAALWTHYTSSSSTERKQQRVLAKGRVLYDTQDEKIRRNELARPISVPSAIYIYIYTVIERDSMPDNRWPLKSPGAPSEESLRSLPLFSLHYMCVARAVMHSRCSCTKPHRVSSPICIYVSLVFHCCCCFDLMWLWTGYLFYRVCVCVYVQLMLCSGSFNGQNWMPRNFRLCDV